MPELLSDRSNNNLDIQAEDSWVNGEMSIPFHERLTCSIADACKATALGKTKIYELISDGTIRTKTVGRRRLVVVESLRSWLQND
jgi:excisionase family DNA binding protein